jgi:NAD-dependent deacetylase
MADDSDPLAEIKDILISSKKVIFLTGAGISKESGIPTFRGKDGLWRTYDPMKLASLSSFLENPSLVWEFYAYRQNLISKCQPNAGHMAISKIQEQKEDCWILTQNVDNLHRRAGSKNIVELHGNIFKVNCIHCDYGDNMTTTKDIGMPPKCPNCESILKPGVVLFEEPLPQKEWTRAIELASTCDLIFIVGTSLNVSPANYLPSLAKENNAILVEVNPEDTWLSNSVDFSIKGSASDILPKIDWRLT